MDPAEPNRWQFPTNEAGVLYGPTGKAPEKLVTCAICFERYPEKDISEPFCGHRHCKNCFTQNVRLAFNSKPFVPAKCCAVIPTEILWQFGALTTDEITQYRAKMEELTNPGEALYCWGCAAYIPLERRSRKIGDCGQCRKRTCRTCRAKSHFGPCDKIKLQADKDDEDNIYRLAESNGWKRCPNCLHLVQKDGGCDKIRSVNTTLSTFACTIY
ncbi:hypothetical protein F4803DRAFT_520616 [Xylaria telfairii]|nr:hypothetical protein F4803DRAFT_520616 [Xylaria telfairii]